MNQRQNDIQYVKTCANKKVLKIIIKRCMVADQYTKKGTIYKTYKYKANTQYTKKGSRQS